MQLYNRKLDLDQLEIEHDHMFKKYVIAIQDFNRLDNLEKTIPDLSIMRGYRVSECHYITDQDSTEDINKKRLILGNKLSNMPSEIEKRFEEKYPGIINSMKNKNIFNDVVVGNLTQDLWWET